MLGFKFYCSRTFDDDCKYYTRANLSDAEALQLPGGGKGGKRAGDRLSTKFGHPALYKPLPTPMVHAKAVEALKKIYRGRLDSSDSEDSVGGGYSDIAMHSMSASKPGKTAQVSGPFEVVPENQLDFSYFKDRPDFRDEFGGGIYGRPDDLISERSQTPKSFLIGKGMAEFSPTSSRASSPTPSLPSQRNNPYENPNPYETFDLEPPPPRPHRTRSPSSFYRQPNESEMRLLSHAQMPAESGNPGTMQRWLSGNSGYGPVQKEDHDPMSYDYFRGRR
ncbi:hypothetical protein VTN02DRAFT_3160 [Thermoascus thermophilus]